ncbi:MAG: class I SAM-dependent methyltransferase [Candidatus Omnitrophota bacterium]
MTNTTKSFRNKWFRNKKLAFAETLRENSDIFLWILRRNGFKSAGAFKRYLSEKKRILDAGCGNGRVTALMRKYTDPRDTQIIGIDKVSARVARENLLSCKNVSIFSKDLLKDLSSLGKLDFIYCQEVLHHTGNPLKAFKNLCSCLERGGEIAIYVYRKKSPTREYADDYIRSKVSCLGYKKAMKECEQITRLGKQLSESNVKIKIPNVDVLQIIKGEYTLQRFVYHFFMKCFWNPKLSFKENVAINYDWYHPQDASRHTVEEVRSWFKKAGLRTVHEHVDFYGITIRGRK